MTDKAGRTGPRQLARAAALMARMSRMPAARAAPGPTDRQGRGNVTGTPFHVYEPPGGSSCAAVALPGLSVNGGRDHRLVYFARCLAKGGVRTVVPTLPGLAACRFDSGDVVALQDVCCTVAEQVGTEVGLIGFSVAGSYALVAAATCASPVPIRFVLTVGAYHRLMDTLEYHRERHPSYLMLSEQQQGELYLNLALAYGHPEELCVPADVHEQLRPLLARFSSDPPVRQSQQLYERSLRDLDLVAAAVRRLPPELADALSPAGKLASLSCPVRLLHAQDDALVPNSQCQQLMAELVETSPAGDHWHLVTPLLSHVTLAGVLRVVDLYRIVSAFSLVFEDATR